VSALGAAYMAGLKAGVYNGLSNLQQLNSNKITVSPAAANKAKSAYEGWKQVITGLP
jgi:glycerol kinase